MNEILGDKALESKIDSIYKKLNKDPLVYVDDADVEITYDLNRHFLGCKIYLTVGGPTIWLNTRTCILRGTWGTQEYGRGIDPAICKNIDDFYYENYGLKEL